MFRPLSIQERYDQRAAEKLEHIDQLIDRYSVDAVRVINVKMRRSKNERVQLMAAKDLADRGTKTAKTKKVQQMNLHAILTPEQLASMAKTAAEIRDFGHPIEPVELQEHVVIPDGREADPLNFDDDEDTA